jgi:hypothetical protein
MHVIILYTKLRIAELTTGTQTSLKVIHKGVIQEGLVKHREEVTIGLNL